MATGVLRNGKVIVEDAAEGSRLHAKARPGCPLEGGGLELDPIEAMFLVGLGSLRVISDDVEGEPLTSTAVLGSRSSDGGVAALYSVYSDLRTRSYIVTLEDDAPCDLRVWKKGHVPGKHPSDYWVVVTGEDDPLDLDAAVSLWERARSLQKQVVFALVDEESDLNYYSFQTMGPHGDLMPVPAPSLQDALAAMPDDPRSALGPPERSDIPVFKRSGTAFYTGKDESSLAMHASEFFGRVIDPYLWMSPVEVLHLWMTGRIEVEGVEGPGDFQVLAEDLLTCRPEMALTSVVYHDLKARGLRVKTGYKFGCHFRAYTTHQDRDHARFLVWCSEDDTFSWREICRAQRLAHGVRKQILIARPHTRARTDMNDRIPADPGPDDGFKGIVGYTLIKRWVMGGT